MSNGLSQAEIDALLRGETLPSETEEQPDASALISEDDLLAGFEVIPEPGEELESAPPPAESFSGNLPGTEGILTDMEIDTLGEIGNISMGTAATTLFTLLSHKVDITTPHVGLTSMRTIAKEYPLPFVAVEVEYTHGLEGTNILFLRENDVKIITDLLMGGDGTNISHEFSELHLSAISEVMNQMVGSSSTSLAKLMGLSIDISPPHAFQINLATDASTVYNDIDEVIVRISFQMVVEGLIDSQIMQVMPVKFAKNQVQNLLSGGASAAAGMASPKEAPKAPPPTPAATHSPPAPQAAPPPPPPPPQPQYQQPQPQPQAQYQQAAPPGGYTPPPQQQPYGYPPPPQYDPYAAMGYPPQGYQQPPYGYPQSPPPPPPQQNQQQQQMVDVRPANFGNFDSGGFGVQLTGENMDLLMDVPLTVSVELGKSSKFIKEILDFNIGTIVVLDKMAGELVDIVVNGKLIAKGEVVVIDDNYGARITDIVSPSKRIGPGK